MEGNTSLMMKTFEDNFTIGLLDLQQVCTTMFENFFLIYMFFKSFQVWLIQTEGLISYELYLNIIQLK